jgi:hypothetical protein
MAARFPGRRAIRLARALEKSRVPGHGGADIGAGNWGQYGAVLHRERRAAESTAVSASRRAGDIAREQAEFRNRFDLVSQFLGLAERQSDILLDGSAAGHFVHFDGTWGNGAGERFVCELGLFPATGGGSGPRSRLCRWRRSRGRRPDGDDHCRLLETKVQFGAGRRGESHQSGRQGLHHHRGDSS